MQTISASQSIRLTFLFVLDFVLTAGISWLEYRNNMAHLRVTLESVLIPIAICSVLYVVSLLPSFSLEDEFGDIDYKNLLVAGGAALVVSAILGYMFVIFTAK